MKPFRQSLSPDEEAIEATAAAWLAQRDDGLSGMEAEEFARWRQADPRHAAAVARLERTWASLQQLREFRPESRVHPNADLLAGSRPAPRILSFPSAALAGLAAVLAIGAFLLWPRPVEPAPPVAAAGRVYATPAGGYQRLTLDDGSVLELNADSVARVEFSPAARRVQLVRGEAHFTVTKDPARPFLVAAGRVTVRAVGTAFNVRLDQSVEVLVTEGRVRVEGLAAGAASELSAGQRLVASVGKGAGTATVEEVPAAVVQTALAWQGPWLRFVDTPLAEVVARFNRHNQLQLELADPTLAARPVDGNFRAENVEAFVRLLESDPTLRTERAGPDRIILRRSP